MSSLPVPMPPSQPERERDPEHATHYVASTAGMADIADYPTVPLPPLPADVREEVTQDDLLDLAQMRTLRLLPLEKRGEFGTMLRLIAIGHAREARRLGLLITEEDGAIAQMCEVAASYRAQEFSIAAIAAPERTDDDLRRLRVIQRKLREVGHDIATAELSRADHDRERQEHLHAQVSIERNLRPLFGEGRGQS